MGTFERRQREKKLREQQILEAAVKIIMEKGYNGATIESIAGEAEVSTGTIYLYFKNKEELYASLNLKIIEEFDRELTRLLRDDRISSEDKLKLAWDSLYSIASQSPVNMRALVHGQLQGSLQNISPALLDRLNTMAKAIMKKIAGIFREGIKEGKIKNANPNALADLFWGMFTGLVSWEEAKHTTDPGKDFLQPTLDMAFDVFMKGIKG